MLYEIIGDLLVVFLFLAIVCMVLWIQNWFSIRGIITIDAKLSDYDMTEIKKHFMKKADEADDTFFV